MRTKYPKVDDPDFHDFFKDDDFKDLKKATPDNKFKSKMPVVVDKNIKSLVFGYDIPPGIYYFDKWDKRWPDTCFICKNTMFTKTLNVYLNDISPQSTKK